MPLNFPSIVKGSIARLKARFRDRETNELVTMTGGSATIRVVDANNGVVVGDAACTIDDTTVYYDWDTGAVPAGSYKLQFAGDPPSGTMTIEPAEPLRVVVVRRIGE